MRLEHTNRLRACFGLLLFALCRPAVGMNEPHWPQWERFKQLYVTADGRVVDRSTPEQITTSEGQSYALFFALVANDRPGFAQVLGWTQNNLAGGDLSRRLPAWQWGRAPNGEWRVLDANAASDSDLWIAYALGEAGRLWCDRTYAQLGRALASRILREETALIPQLGPTLLPGPKGFVERDAWRLNASYAPLQVLRGIARQTNEKLWNDVARTAEKLIIGSAPRGFAADWSEYRPREGFMPDRKTQGVGSYNAIRVYLWAGMLAPRDPAFAQLSRHLAPMVASASQRATIVETVGTMTLQMSGEGSPGFSAALLPMLANAQQTRALDTHRERAAAHALRREDAYYSDVLTLFGLGWLEQRYRFERNGQVAVTWTPACRGAP